MKNKKGISAVVATVLIILITVAAVTIIWAAIMPMINDQLSKGTVCLDAVSQLTIKNKGYTCIDGNDLKIQIGHGANEVDLADIQVLIYAAGDTQSVSLVGDSIVADASALPSINEEKTFTITPTDASIVDSVAIAPIVTIGGSTQSCDAVAPVMIRACN